MAVADFSQGQWVLQARASFNGVEHNNQKALADRLSALLAGEKVPQVDARELGGAIARLEVAHIPLNDTLKRLLWQHEAAVRVCGLWQEKLLWKA